MTTSAEEARNSAIEAHQSYALESEEEGGVLAYLQSNLWDQLIDARRSSRSGVWSIACDGIVHRVAWLTKLTQKPTGWGDVPVELVLDGTFEAIHEAIGMPTPLTDEDRARAKKHYDEHISPNRPRRGIA